MNLLGTVRGFMKSMKTKLWLAVLLLVILPTAVLSLMASRSILHREQALQYQLEHSAAYAVRSVANRVSSKLGGYSERIEMEMSSCLAQGLQFERIQEVANRYSKSHELVEQVYLFMNPWGFVYPDERGVEPGYQAESSLQSVLVSDTRHSISMADSTSQSVCFSSSGIAYCLTAIDSKEGLYAGYSVQEGALGELLTSFLKAASGEGFRLRAKGQGLDLHESIDGGGIIVGDSLSAEQEGGNGNVGVVLATGRLAPPFEYVEISAIAEMVGGVPQGLQSKMRLQSWGIVLMAVGICAGVLVVLIQSSSEVERERSKSDFVVGVSHDLRTPVASMKMLAESLYLDRVSDPVKQKKFLSTIIRESERLSQLVERVLFLVRFGQDAVEHIPKSCDPVAFVSDVVETFRARFDDVTGGKWNPVIGLEVEKGIEQVNIDEASMTQVLLNLLDNALKYSAATGGEVRLDVSVRRVDNGVGIAVRDNGVGIVEGEIKKIFRKFYRVPGAADSNVSGVGMGLALCKHIVDAHGGRIEVESEVGEGSEFCVVLPLSGDR